MGKDTTSLKGCPFCGSLPRFVKRPIEDTPQVGLSLTAMSYYVVCTECDAIGPSKDTAEEAVDSWNYRSRG